MIPNIIHFIYPVTEKTRPFSYINSLAIRMAHHVQKPDQIMLWTNAKKDIDYWDDIKDIVNIVPAKIPSNFRGVDIKYPQYASDVMRLRILYNYGGIYMDTDMLLLKPLDDHISSDKLIFSWENPQKTSISNALMMSPIRNQFLQEWLDVMPVALSCPTWAYGGVTVPAVLAEKAELEEYRTVLPHTFCCPLDLSEQWLMNPALADEAARKVEGSHAIHMWETYWRDYVKHLTPEYIKTGQCLFSRIARDFEKKTQHEAGP